MTRTVTPSRHPLVRLTLGLLGMVASWAVAFGMIVGPIALGLAVLDDVSAKLEEGHSQPCSQVLGAGASEEDRAGTCGTVPMGEDGGE